MPLWSLTQERVEKLRRQIGEIEMEVDTLIKLSKEDLWKRDLDIFIDEWRAQLDEEYKRKRRINNMGRRASSKVKVGASRPTIKKRKGLGDHDDDDDFDERPKTKKPAPPKVNRKEVIVEKKQGLLKDFVFGKATQGKRPHNFHDGNSSEMEVEDAVDTTVETNNVKPATQSKSAPVLKHEEDEEIVPKPVARKARAAASKPIQYGVDGSDSDSSNGDDLLGDITSMVKGLPGGETDSSSDKKSLFSTSRIVPNSSASLKAPPPAIKKSYAEISDDDDTNFMGLIPQQSPRRSINVTKNAQLTDEEDEEVDNVRPLTANKARSQPAKSEKAVPATKSKAKAKAVPKSDTEDEPELEAEDEEEDDDEDEDDFVITTKPKPRTTAATSSKPTTEASSRPAKATASKAAAVKKAPAPREKKNSKSTTTTAGPAKKTPLSPAAKAYAAKQAKNNKKKTTDKFLDSDDEDEDAMVEAMADDLLDSPPPPAVSKTAKSTTKEDVDVDVDAADSDDSPPPPSPVVTTAAAAAAAAKRPARRAAVTAAAKRKAPVYVLSDDEEDGDEDGGSEVNDDEDESDDFDGSE